MTGLDRITIDPNQMNGQPCIRNMRLAVRRVLEAFALYPNRLSRTAQATALRLPIDKLTCGCQPHSQNLREHRLAARWNQLCS